MLEWAKTSENRMNWDKAINYCKDLDFGGCKDWRLPTVEELITLINYSKLNPASDLNMLSYFYWSSSIYANSTDYAWFVYFFNGNVDVGNKTSSCCVRPVRDNDYLIIK